MCVVREGLGESGNYGLEGEILEEFFEFFFCRFESGVMA